MTDDTTSLESAIGAAQRTVDTTVAEITELVRQGQDTQTATAQVMEQTGLSKELADIAIMAASAHASPMTDAQLIRALIAKLGGSVEFTLDDVAAARKPSSLQYDGLKITLQDAR